MKLIKTISQNYSLISYNGKTVKFNHDGRCYFINMLEWEDGSTLSIPEKKEFLKAAFEDGLKPEGERCFEIPVKAFDLDKEQAKRIGVYGEEIDFDENHNPCVIEKDGDLKAFYRDCVCKKRGEREMTGKADIENFLREIKSEGLFKRYAKSSFGKKQLFECVKCGQKWEFEKYSNPTAASWRRKMDR